MTVLFVGGGNMASSLIAGMLSGGRSAAELRVLDPNEDQRRELLARYDVEGAAPSELAQASAKVVVWAVKPQHLKMAAQQAGPGLRSSLHVSIAAGVSAATLSRWLNAPRVVRAMPNSAAAVGKGCTGMFALDAVSTDDRALAQEILAATGSLFWLESDLQVDAITAVSGSGPAYVFQFLESLQSAASGLGFSEDVARELALRTVEGAVAQAHASGDSFGALRQRVTSDKGTTAAALTVLNERSVAQAYELAVQAAFQRAQEIGHEWATS